MGGVIDLRIITPDGLFHEGAASSVMVKTVDGWLGLLPGRAPVCALLADDGCLQFRPAAGQGLRAAKEGGGQQAVDGSENHDGQQVPRGDENEDVQPMAGGTKDADGRPVSRGAAGQENDAPDTANAAAQAARRGAVDQGSAVAWATQSGAGGKEGAAQQAFCRATLSGGFLLMDGDVTIYTDAASPL